MTVTALQADSANTNTRDNLNEAALEIQALTRRVRHLVEAIRDTYDNLHLDSDRKDVLNRMDRVSVFADLIDDASEAAGKRAEFIEGECPKLPKA